MIPDLNQQLKQQLTVCKNKEKYRSLTKNKYLYDFLSNDYLGFSQNILLRKKLIEKMSKLPLGSTGSRLLSGNHSTISETEKRICKFFKAKSSALYTSGYALNIGLLPCLAKKNDIILLDKNIHVSLKNSAKLSSAKTFYFHHNDAKHLKSRLERLKKTYQNSHFFVVVESIYSMDGDLAPLEELEDICSHHSAYLIVDEAHAVGISGSYGEGLVPSLPKKKAIFARIITFGKAFGVQGAALLGEPVLNEWIKNFCHSFIYTTAPSPIIATAIRNSIDELEKNSCHFSKIRSKINEASKIFMFPDWKSPIFPFFFSETKKLDEITLKIKTHKFGVLPIKSPTVNKGKERLRICVHNFNSKEEISSLFSLLK